MVAGYFDNGWVVANKPLQCGTNKSLALRVVVVECVSSVVYLLYAICMFVLGDRMYNTIAMDVLIV